jgi:hypothetical protein
MLKIQARGEVICAFSHFSHLHPAGNSTINLTILKLQWLKLARSGIRQGQRTTNLTYKSQMNRQRRYQSCRSNSSNGVNHQGSTTNLTIVRTQTFARAHSRTINLTMLRRANSL